MLDCCQTLSSWTFAPAGDDAWNAYAWADFCNNDCAIHFFVSRNGERFSISDYGDLSLQAVRMGFRFEPEVFDWLNTLNASGLAVFHAYDGIKAECDLDELPLALQDALQLAMDFSFYCLEHGSPTIEPSLDNHGS